MFRGAILAGGVALAVTSFVYGQQPTTPPVPEDALAPRELIAWSNLQTPQPAQEPLLTVRAQAREPNQQPAGAQGQQQREQSHDTAQSRTRDSRTQTQ